MGETEFKKETESFFANISINESEIQFKLFTRSLKLSSYGTIQYYWMNPYPNRITTNSINAGNSAKINSRPKYSRKLADEDSYSNYASIVRYWSELCYAEGYHFKHLGLTPWLLALCYPIVCDSKSIQNIYNDAHFAPSFNRRLVDEIPDETRELINKTVLSKDFNKIQNLLDLSFNRKNDLKVTVDEYQEEFGNLLQRGKELVLKELNEGILKFRQEIKGFISRIRRRSGNISGKTFVNILSYNFKYAYYDCCSAAWNALIPWIKENRGLDSQSEGFLRLWHNQNRTIVIPVGKTLADVQGVPFDFLSNDPFYEKEQKLVYEGGGNPKIDPVEIRDSFNGQILALHPLSMFFMSDESLLGTAGQFFFSQDYKDALKNGLSMESEPYLNLVKGILLASFTYKISREREKNRDLRRPTKSIDEIDI